MSTQSTATGPSRESSWTRLAAGLVAGTFTALVYLDRKRPLRRRQTEPKRRRYARNLTMAGLSALAIHLAERPVTQQLAGTVQRRRWGLLQRMSLSGWLEIPLAVALMDYTLYLWHVLLHRVPFLWRFHQPHHVDLDMDTSTAVRFHFGEMLLSVPWRAAQILLLGVSRKALFAWQTFTLVEIMFHHSNVRLPPGLERRLGSIVVTPRMHGIHHSIVEIERNSNWSSGLSIWDRVHGTLRRDVPQDEIVIGLPARRSPREVTLGKALEMPFRRQGQTATGERRLQFQSRIGSFPREGICGSTTRRERSGSPKYRIYKRKTFSLPAIL